MLSTLHQPGWVMACRPADRPANRITGYSIGAASRPVAPMTMWEADDRLWIEFDVPGFAQEDIDVTFENGELHISGERKFVEDRTYFANERRFGTFRRNLELSKDLDPESIEAELHNGLLTISLAKQPEAQPQKIKIRHASEAKA